MSNSTLKLSVFMLAYNHENFIKQAIDSILMQKVNFDYNIVIGEDFSTDNTRKILLDYKRQYPEKITLILRDKNVGAMQNQLETFAGCKGEYMAILEGDDYWTDENKLQKQVDFLEANKDFSICFTNAMILEASCDSSGNEALKNEKNVVEKLFLTKLLNGTEVNQSRVFTIEDILPENFLPSMTCVFRKNFDELPEWFSKCIIGDWPLHILNAGYGKLMYMNDVTAIYRKHTGGVYSQVGWYKQLEVTIKASETIFNNLAAYHQGFMIKPMKAQIATIIRLSYLDGNVQSYVKYFFKYLRLFGFHKEPVFIIKRILLLNFLIGKRILGKQKKLELRPL